MSIFLGLVTAFSVGYVLEANGIGIKKWQFWVILFLVTIINLISL